MPALKIFKFSKIILVPVLIFFCLDVSSVIGTCLNYGHACWGAHGKRSETQNNLIDTLLKDAMRQPIDYKLRPARYSNSKNMYIDSKIPTRIENQIPEWIVQYEEKLRRMSENDLVRE